MICKYLAPGSVSAWEGCKQPLINSKHKGVGLLACAWVAAASWVSAEVTVAFLNTTLPQGTTNELGTLSLEFHVDGAGSVTLDASTTRSEQIIVDAVDGWDGPVGSVGFAGAFNTAFTLVLDDAGGSGLKLTANAGGGLGVGGQNAWRIDRPGLESIAASASLPEGTMHLRSIAWNWRANDTVDLLLSVPGGQFTNHLASDAGSWNLADQGIRLATGEQFAFGNVDLGAVNDGYALAGLAFDIVDDAAPPAVADLAPDNQTAYTTGMFDGKAVWVSGSADGQLYFDVPDAFGFVPGQPVYVRIEYHDSGNGRLLAEYDSTMGSTTADKFRDSETHARSSRMDGGGFVYNYHEFKYPLFNGRQNGGNDFRFKLQNSDGTPLRVAGVRISTAPYDDEMFQYALSEPWLEPYAGEVHDFVDNQTLAGKVMTGYQGWFGAPNDVMDSGWTHWGRGSNAKPDESWMTVDMWPYLDDYSTDGLYKAGDLLHRDGRPAYLFSSRDPATVQRHFRWMRTHGIDGAYLQYFVNASRSGANGGKQFVLNNVMEAAAKEGRIWALEYDVSGLSTNFNEAMDIMTNDWNWMVNEAQITQDPRYAHENGKPVVFIWGFPVESREFPVELADAVIDWFAAQNLYLICGTRWRNEPEWQAHFRKYDQLLIWMERDLGVLNSRKSQLESWGMKILPHAWPGFSWNNLQMTQYPTSHTARNGGAFYWERLYNAVACGADQIFLGMFDEYDEGTAIMPMSDNHPNIYTDGTNTWGHYLDNEGRDPFWYLQLSDAAREMLNGQRALSATIPLESEITPAAFGGEDATAYLGTDIAGIGLAHTQPADGLTGSTFLGNQPCRTNAGPYFYFAIDDAFCSGVAEGQAATIELEYYDDVAGRTLRLQYDGVSSAYALHPGAERTPGASGWKAVRWNVDDAFFGNRQNGMSDFRIGVDGGDAVAIRRVSVFLPEERGGSPTDAPRIEFADTGLGWPEVSDATGWRLFESFNLASDPWSEVAGPFAFSNGMVRYDAMETNSASFFRLQRPAKK